MTLPVTRDVDAVSPLEAAGFYDVLASADPIGSARPADPVPMPHWDEVAELRRVLKDVVQAALYYRGPLHRPHLEDTLLNIGRAVDELFQ